SALGHKQTYAVHQAMSALPTKATTKATSAKHHVRFTPRKRTCAAHPAMSALGQKQTYAVQLAMSALPPKADMCAATSDVRFGPLADSCGAAEGIDRGQFHSEGTRTH